MGHKMRRSVGIQDDQVLRGFGGAKLSKELQIARSMSRATSVPK